MESVNPEWLRGAFPALVITCKMGFFFCATVIEKHSYLVKIKAAVARQAERRLASRGPASTPTRGMCELLLCLQGLLTPFHSLHTFLWFKGVDEGAIQRLWGGGYTT